MLQSPAAASGSVDLVDNTQWRVYRFAQTLLVLASRSGAKLSEKVSRWLRPICAFMLRLRSEHMRGRREPLFVHALRMPDLRAPLRRHTPARQGVKKGPHFPLRPPLCSSASKLLEDCFHFGNVLSPLRSVQIQKACVLDHLQICGVQLFDLFLF